MTWSNAYVGIPYRDLGRDRHGCDCWGLARLIYANELKIELPSFAAAYDSAENSAEVSALLAHHNAAPWHDVGCDIRQFDLILLRLGRHDTHIGVAINNTLMVHMARGEAAKVESFCAATWSSRFVSAHRHALSPINDRFEVAS